MNVVLYPLDRVELDGKTVSLGMGQEEDVSAPAGF